MLFLRRVKFYPSRVFFLEYESTTYSFYFKSMPYTENGVQIDLSDNKRVQYDSKAIYFLAVRCCN